MRVLLVETDKNAIDTLKMTGHSDEDFYNTVQCTYILSYIGLNKTVFTNLQFT
jgi:hypothetical protein